MPKCIDWEKEKKFIENLSKEEVEMCIFLAEMWLHIYGGEKKERAEIVRKWRDMLTERLNRIIAEER